MWIPYSSDLGSEISGGIHVIVRLRLKMHVQGRGLGDKLCVYIDGFFLGWEDDACFLFSRGLDYCMELDMRVSNMMRLSGGRWLPPLTTVLEYHPQCDFGSGRKPAYYLF